MDFFLEYFFIKVYCTVSYLDMCCSGVFAACKSRDKSGSSPAKSFLSHFPHI